MLILGKFAAAATALGNIGDDQALEPLKCTGR